MVFVFFAVPVYAQQGCCSWHGGIDYCDEDVETYVCNDGTYSETCGCEVYYEEAPTINLDRNTYSDELKRLLNIPTNTPTPTPAPQSQSSFTDFLVPLGMAGLGGFLLRGFIKE